MNYYIQGNKEKADQIKAAFEKFGYNTRGLNFSDGFFYTVERDVHYCVYDYMVNFIKTHPDYKELELPVEPKFKKWDWIACDADSFTLSIKSVKDGNYFFHQGASLPIKDIDEHYHLWTIQDAKDGDVLVLNGFSKGYKWIGIFKALTSDTSFSSHCHYNCGMCEFVTDIARCTKHGIKYNDIRPATNGERDILFAKMQEAGYEWDAEKKELKKFPKHYDISSFHAGMPVLVRDSDNDEWTYTYFSHITDSGDFNTGGWTWRQCIPFDENEHLLGTSDSCDKQYINW